MALLSYGFSTAPAPLQTSTALAATDGRINLAIFNPRRAYCDQIQVHVYAGDTARSFGADAPAGAVSTTKWVLADLTPPLRADQPLTYMFSCVSEADELIDYDLAFSLSGVVNQAVGPLLYEVSEHSGTERGNLVWSEVITFEFEKVTPRFYLVNLAAIQADAPLVPCTEVPANTPFLLSWESNGTWFEVYQKANPTPIYAGSATSCSVAGVTTDSTFFVVGSVSGNPGAGPEPPSFQQISLYASVSVTVSNPLLTPTSVVAAHSIHGESLSATNEVSGAALTATGPISGATISTSGRASLASLQVPGAAQAGSVTAGTLEAGATVITSSFTANRGPATMLAKSITLSPGRWLAKTDGFLIGQVIGTSSLDPGTVGYAIADADDLTVFATGGNMVVPQRPGKVINQNAFTLPVRNGQEFQLWASQVGDGSKTPAPIFFNWVPLGADPRLASVVHVGDADAEPPVRPDQLESNDDHAAARFVELLEHAFELPLDQQRKQALIAALHEL